MPAGALFCAAGLSIPPSFCYCLESVRGPSYRRWVFPLWLTGRGLGERFLGEGMALGARLFRPEMFRLTVAAFNKRAIRVYERAGFVHSRRYAQWTRGGTREFIEMTRPAGLGAEQHHRNC